MPNLHSRLKKLEVISMRRANANDDEVFRVAGLSPEEARRRILTYFLDQLEPNDIPAALRSKVCASIAGLLPLVESSVLAERCRAAIARSDLGDPEA